MSFHLFSLIFQPFLLLFLRSGLLWDVLPTKQVLCRFAFETTTSMNIFNFLINRINMSLPLAWPSVSSNDCRPCDHNIFSSGLEETQFSLLSENPFVLLLCAGCCDSDVKVSDTASLHFSRTLWHKDTHKRHEHTHKHSLLNTNTHSLAPSAGIFRDM